MNLKSIYQQIQHDVEDQNGFEEAILINPINKVIFISSSV